MISELTPVSANWKNIDTALRLNPNTLDIIQANNNNDSTACLTSMVTEWLKRNYSVEKFGEPPWRWLVKAVGDPAGGANMALARDISRRHKAGGRFWNNYSAKCLNPTHACPCRAYLCVLLPYLLLTVKKKRLPMNYDNAQNA